MVVCPWNIYKICLLSFDARRNHQIVTDDLIIFDCDATTWIDAYTYEGSTSNQSCSSMLQCVDHEATRINSRIK